MDQVIVNVEVSHLGKKLQRQFLHTEVKWPICRLKSICANFSKQNWI